MAVVKERRRTASHRARLGQSAEEKKTRHESSTYTQEAQRDQINGEPSYVKRYALLSDSVNIRRQ